MKKINYIFVLLLLLPILLQSQVRVINKNATIRISNGTNFKVQDGSFLNENGSEVINDGNLNLGLNFTQNTGATYVGGSSSWLCFEGSTHQLIISDALLEIAQLRVNNGQRLILGSDMNVSSSIDLNNNGTIDLGPSNLSLDKTAVITNYDESNYILTSSTGTLQQEVGTSSVVFPIGNSTYNPATISNSGTLDNFQLRVVDQVLANGTTGDIKTSHLVDRTWLIEEETIGGSNATLTLEWASSDELVYFDRSASGVSHHLNGSLWDNPSNYIAACNLGNNRWAQTRGGFTSFSPFVVSNRGASLPIELLSFEAERTNIEQVKLDWVTASETNNHGFYLERMLEGEDDFSPITFIEGMGTTLELSNYEFIDDNSASGISYYRLQQVDFDGTTSYSDIRAVSGIEQNNTGQTLTSIYPNPVRDKLKVRFQELPKDISTASVQVISINGQILHQFDANVSSNQILEIQYVNQLPPALYILSIKLNNGRLIEEKFIKK